MVAHTNHCDADTQFNGAPIISVAVLLERLQISVEDLQKAVEPLRNQKHRGECTTAFLSLPFTVFL